MGPDAFETFDSLRDAYLRYYDTPFGLADERIEAERRALLDKPGGIYTEPLIELRPEYLTTRRSIASSAAAAGQPAELAEFLECGLLRPGMELYTHQERALHAGVQRGRNVVITAGTGSGKTESFLLPVLASLIAESRDWGGGPASFRPWWRNPSQPYSPQRAGETGRRQAVRALVLYPMNALVDDQLIRLRRALDSDEARAWLDRNRNGHRLFFGRYTGATPVTGRPGQNQPEAELRRFLRVTEERGRRACASDDDNTRYFVPRLDGAEMRSRWDMADAPPDILITNYSMLNVMLLRDRDQHFFERTRQWLDSDPEARFTLVVDELHMYRGTAGTEVAYLIRNLKHRLGITGKPEKFRVLAASASLDPRRDRTFLEQFFAIDAESFEFIGGESPPARTTSADVGHAAVALGAITGTGLSPEHASKLLAETGAADGLAAALRSPADGSPETVSAGNLASRLFPNVSPADGERALRGLLTAIRVAGRVDVDLPKIRSHLFFRNVPGMWACADPKCPDVRGSGGGQRMVGRLYSEPRTRCTCGARVLELLYCQNCGDIMLGGFAARSAFARASFNAPVFPDVPELTRLPDQAPQDRSAANYVVYWPSTNDQQADDDAKWTAAGLTFQFRRSRLEPSAGQLANGVSGATGWSFHITSGKDQDGRPKIDLNKLSPFPTRCPGCGADWEITRNRHGILLPVTDPLRQRSPIRTMRTGFEKTNQLLASELAAQMDARERKLILFSDSRQDAAKLAAGVGLRHYQDLVRLLLHEVVGQHGVPGEDLALARLHADGDRSDKATNAYQSLRARYGTRFTALYMAWVDDDEAAAKRAEAELTSPPTLKTLMTVVQQQLLELGVNPAGTAASVQERSGEPWYKHYDWQPRIPRPRQGLTEAEVESMRLAEVDLLENIIQALFSGAGRDFESLGLGWLALKGDVDGVEVPPASTQAIARSSLRILAELRRFEGFREGRTVPPKRLKTYWAKAAKVLGLDVGEVQLQAEAGWGNCVTEFLIDSDQVALRRASELAWRCPRCRRQHLVFGAGACTRCGSELPHDGNPVSDPGRDYYAWKAASGHGRFRLACVELTGQTGRVEAQQRQARFQGVFLQTDEEPRAQGVDLLSVTTTMEAGVDIGALSAVVMANMPPTRFNYQQRVGRAGRRGSPVAVALTVCRGRSHDEHYFQHPSAITNDPTPPPYLALDRHEILRRSIASEILRVAFEVLADELESDPEWHYERNVASVHGQFGYAADWPVAAPRFRRWLGDNLNTALAITMALTDHTDVILTATELRDWLEQLQKDIDKSAMEDIGDVELSQRLAEAGVLPMFGFPTKVRLLHLAKPKKGYPWPPDDTIDRNLPIAVSQFAPGSEVVKDGVVYPVVGLAAFRPQRPRPLSLTEPLSNSRNIGLCRACNHVNEAPLQGQPATTCPVCKSGEYQEFKIGEPAGFRAGKGRDFDGTFAWSPRRVTARATSNLPDLAKTSAGAAEVYAGRGKRYVINDNNGQLFEFRPSADPKWGGYVDVTASDLDPSVRGSGEAFTAALGATLPTDLFFVGPRSTVIPDRGLRLNLSGAPTHCASDISDGRRSAWYSLAFLLRSAAAVHLDIQPLELVAGVHSAAHPDGYALYAFLADTLENGAGFSSHLGLPNTLPAFIEAVERYQADLSDPIHSAECTSSCYRCLRDYSNMAYHPLLDWRLARDLLHALMHEKLHTDADREQQSLRSWATAWGATMVAGTPANSCMLSQGKLQYAVVVKHPLESCESIVASPRLSATIAELNEKGVSPNRVIISDFHTLDMAPMRVIEALQTAYKNQD